MRIGGISGIALASAIMAAHSFGSESIYDRRDRTGASGWGARFGTDMKRWRDSSKPAKGCNAKRKAKRKAQRVARRAKP